ncbi:MAG TPA: ABC transporter ATP-binding protein [Candidatus Dormibacteraeota bacterium]
MTAAIETVGLTKTYGQVRALDGLDLVVDEGSIFGFLGPNGAGKTTTVRLLTGLAHPTTGVVKVLGSRVRAGDTVGTGMGFLPDVPGFYDWMTGGEFLRFAGSLFGTAKPQLESRLDMLLDLAGLVDVKTKIGGYSRGMKQRLGIAQALINAPRLLVLDEPTSALDPIGRKEVLEMLASLRGRSTVFFSTHILADVDRVCDTVAIIDRGRLVVQAPMRDLKSRYASHKLVLEVTDGADALAAEIAAQPWAAAMVRAPNGAIEVTVSDMSIAQREIPVLVAARGLGLSRLEAGEVQLEEVFVELVGGNRR